MEYVFDMTVVSPSLVMLFFLASSIETASTHKVKQ